MTTKFKQVKTEALIPYARNSRLHPDSQIDQIAASIKEFGFLSPCVISGDNTIIAGHGRVMAAKKLGIETVPCVIADHLTEGQRRAYVLIDNRLTDASTWDAELLQLELGDLALNFPDIDISEMGFSPEEIGDLDLPIEEVEGLTDEDAVPEAPKTPTTKIGDIWLLGNHRVMCGDSTDAGNVALLMNGDKASVWASDPPYGISYVDEIANEKGQAKGYEPIANDELQDEALKEFIYKAITSSLPFMKENFAFYMWHAMKMQAYFSQAAAAAGILFHRQIIWVKPQFVFGRGQYHWRHELCLMGWLQGNEPPFYGEKNQSTVWEIARENDKIHPTQKPVDIWIPSITNHTKTGEIIYEPFAGSGSNVIACEKTSRRCFGMELSPQYCDVIVKRWQDFTGRLATLEVDGRTFEEVQRERVG